MRVSLQAGRCCATRNFDSRREACRCLTLLPARNRTGGMKRTVKRFEPVQLGKMLGALYALMGLVFVPFFILFAVIGAFAQPNSGNQAGAGAIAIGVAAGMALAMPICYGVFGF